MTTLQTMLELLPNETHIDIACFNGESFDNLIICNETVRELYWGDIRKYLAYKVVNIYMRDNAVWVLEIDKA